MITLPTITDLYNDIITDLETEYGVTISPFGKSFLRALSAEEAAKFKLFYLAIGNLQKNIWCDTADPVAQGGTLERFGFVKLQRLPFPGTQGKYTVNVTGIATSVIPALSVWKSDDGSLNPGHLYILDTAHTMAGSTDSITLRSLDAGTGALLAVTDTLTAVQPIIGVNAGAVVTAIAVSPIEAETIEEYRAKVIEAYQLSPQGGASADYRLWAADAHGVRQSYPYTYSGHANEINLFVEAILADSLDGKGTPTTTILDDVAADIETDPDTGRGRRPLGVFLVNTQAIVLKEVNITINSGGTITADQQVIITAAITEALYNIRPFIPGAQTLLSRNDVLNTFLVGSIVIEAVPVVILSAITLRGAGATDFFTSYTFDNGIIPWLNTVTYL